MGKQKKRIERMGRVAFALFAASLLTSCGGDWESDQADSVSILSHGGDALEITNVATTEKGDSAADESKSAFTGQEIVSGVFFCTGPVAALLKDSECTHEAVTKDDDEIEGLKTLVISLVEVKNPKFFSIIGPKFQSGDLFKVKGAYLKAQGTILAVLDETTEISKKTDEDGHIISSDGKSEDGNVGTSTVHVQNAPLSSSNVGTGTVVAATAIGDDGGNTNGAGPAMRLHDGGKSNLELDVYIARLTEKLAMAPSNSAR